MKPLFMGFFMAKKTNFKVNEHEYFKVTRTIGYKENKESIKIMDRILN